MGKTYRGDERENFRKKNKKFKRADRDIRKTKRSIVVDEQGRFQDKDNRNNYDDILND